MIWNPGNVPAVRVTAFWFLVDRSAGADACWPFTGYINEDGYGEYFVDGQMVGAHEVALTFTTDERRLPELDTCHSCNTRPCCNPRHIRFDTRQSNVDDMIRSGRHHTGGAKISDAVVRLLRERRAAGAAQDDLAAQFGLSSAYVSMLVRGRVRVDAGGPIQLKNATYNRRGYRKAI